MKKSFAFILLVVCVLTCCCERGDGATHEVTVTPQFSSTDAGTYTGLFYATNKPEVKSAGLLSLTVGASAMCSGKMYCGGIAYRISPARMDVSGRLRAQSESGLFALDVQLDVVGGKTITGTVSSDDWIAPVVCRRSTSNQSLARFAGRYDVSLSDGSSSADAPLGKAFVAVTVANNGNVTLVGALADNTLLAQQPTVRLNEDGSWPLYSSTRKTNDQGQIYSDTVMGWIRLATGGADGTVVSGNVLWMSDEPTNSFSVSLQAVGQSYSITNPPAFWPAREQVHIYLLMGQSNMAGHGRITAIDKVPNLRVISFGADNFWQPAIDPLHKNHGVGPGLTFAKVMADQNPGVVIALIPTAVDSTSLNRWVRGTAAYNNAVSRALLAMRWGAFKGFLWHQGENDALTSAALIYKTKLAQMITDIRTDLGVPNAPFVVGEIPRFVYHRTEFAYATAVNKRLNGITELVPLTGCVSSEGLTSILDGIHFDGPSQHKMGQGYADIMSSLEAQ